MKAIMKWIRNMAMAFISGQMVVVMKATGSMVNSTVKVGTFCQMET